MEELAKELLKSVILLFYGNCPHFIHWEQCQLCRANTQNLITEAKKRLGIPFGEQQ